ncbi:MAG: hypothetical protein GXP45_02740 [bacterium]|nr:hypothetical protein [bacterium]
MRQNNSYILPYQILAYSHFLTNNRDTAIDYFLKLSNFDPNHGSLYKFLLGTSYYRKNDYNKSILYLNQIEHYALNNETEAQQLL